MSVELRFKWIELHNFKSYRGTHKFTFPQDPGLYLITGKNLIQPRLGSNGVGKSTLLDAIFWALYGRTPRGLRASEVITRGEQTANVKLELAAEKICTIERKQNPNSLTLNGSVLSQETLTMAVGLTPDEFLHSVMLPQFGESFFDLQPAAKLVLFSQVMKLDYWLERSELAAQQTTEIANTLRHKDHELDRQEGQYELLNTDIRVLEGKAVTDHSKTIAGFEAKLATATQKAQAAQANWQKHNDVRLLAENDLIHTGETLDNIGKLGAKCPTCLQRVSGPHLRAEKKRLVTYLTELKTHQRSTLAHCEASQSEFKALQRDIQAISQNLNDFKRKQAEYETVAGMLHQKRTQRADLEKLLKRLMDDADALIAKHKTFEFWVSGFRRVRLFIVDEILRQLEIEVNNNLAALGLPEWRVEFDIERENKSGGVTKGFVVLVYAPLAEQPVRLEAWSGGETQRLRLAGDFGLANLIMDRAGLTNTIEFYDEPSQHLSQEGLLDLLDTLQQRAVDHNRVIIVVDHHALDYGFDGTFTVVKDKTTSRIE